MGYLRRLAEMHSTTTQISIGAGVGFEECGVGRPARAILFAPKPPYNELAYKRFHTSYLVRRL